MTFLADENFSRPPLFALREAGYNVFSVAEEFAGLPDEGVAHLCDQEQRVLLTFDKDFGDLLFQRGLQAGSAVYFSVSFPHFLRKLRSNCKC